MYNTKLGVNVLKWKETHAENFCIVHGVRIHALIKMWCRIEEMEDVKQSYGGFNVSLQTNMFKKHQLF